MDRDEIIRKFATGHDVAQRLGSVLEDLLKHEDLFDGDAGEVIEQKTRLREVLDGLRTSFSEPSYKIAMVGGFSGGKSTLLNEVFGHEILSENVNPETANATVIRKAKSGSEQRLILRYMDEDQYRRYAREVCQIVGIEFVTDGRGLLSAAEDRRAHLIELQDDPIRATEDVPRRIKQVDDLIELVSGYQQNSDLLGRTEELAFDQNVLDEWDYQGG